MPKPPDFKLDQESGIKERNTKWSIGNCNDKKLSPDAEYLYSDCQPFRNGSEELKKLLKKAPDNSEFRSVFEKVLEECDCRVGLEDGSKGSDLKKIHDWLGPRLMKIKKLISEQIIELMDEVKNIKPTEEQLAKCPAISKFLKDNKNIIGELDTTKSLFDSLYKIAEKNPPENGAAVMQSEELEEFIFGFITELVL